MSGLSKAARLQEARKKRKAKNESLPLNPPFPFRVIEFDPTFFKLNQAKPGGDTGNG